MRGCGRGAPSRAMVRPAARLRCWRDRGSVAGDSDRPDVSTTFLQPFFSYAIGGGQTLSLNSETSYDWMGAQWTVPINVGYSKVFNVGDQAMSWQIGARYYAVKPAGGPDWGIRTGLTLVFPEH